MKKSIKEYQLNEELTAQIKKDKKFQVLLDWVRKNGGIIDGIDFPVVFGNNGQIGLISKDVIPAKKIIIAIPNRLLITPLLIDQNPTLRVIVNDSPELFSSEQSEDSDINRITLFLMTEKIKGDKSFWSPYFNAAPQELSLLLDWTDKEIESTGDNYLFQQFKEYKDTVEQKWKIFLKFIVNHPNQISTDCCNKKLFLWCHELASSKSLSSKLPFPFLVPIADSLQHGQGSTINVIFNRSFELAKKKLPKTYALKNKSLDASLFKQITYQPEELLKIHGCSDDKRAYISVNTRGMREKNYLDEATVEQIRNDIQMINAEKLKARVKNLWDLPYFSGSSGSSDDEKEEGDDSQEEDEEQRFEKDQNFSDLKEREALAVRYNLLEGQQYDQMEKQVDEEFKRMAEEGNKVVVNSSTKRAYQDKNWEWYDAKDEETFYTVSVTKNQKKNQQIVHSFGKKDNRYLLLYYGFSMISNPYESYPFRLWNSIPSNIAENQLDIDELVFNDYITYAEEESGVIQYKGQPKSIDSLTKEFKLTRNTVCLDLLAYLRVYLLSTTKSDNPAQQILITLPSSLQFEKRILDFAHKILWALKKRVFQRSSIEDDQKELLNSQLSNHKRYALILNLQQKMIIQRHIDMIKLLQRIVAELITNASIGQGIVKQYEDIEQTDEEYQNNRQAIRHYMAAVYQGIYKVHRNQSQDNNSNSNSSNK